MKKLTEITLIATIILSGVACSSSPMIHFVDLTTKELPSETEVILTTSEPLQYKETRLEDPPCLIISFPEDKVVSNGEDEWQVNKGPINKIRSEHYQEYRGGQRFLNFILMELNKNVPYKISRSGSSIKVTMNNSETSDLASLEETTGIEPDQQTDEALPFLEPIYFIGPGDVLNIEVWKEPEISREVVVNYRGEIRLPPTKRMNVMGLTVPDLEDMLIQALSEYVIDPNIFVTIKEYKSQRVIAYGEVAQGMYTLERNTTLIEFLGQIGGPTEEADVSRVKLIKRNGRLCTVNLNEIINNPKKSQEIFVSGGDTLFVPPLEFKKVYVLGEVSEPKVLTINDNLTVVDAITQAGGCTRDAVLKSVLVIRGELGYQKGIRVDLGRILKKADIGQNIELQGGDIVYVPQSFVVNIERVLRSLALPITWFFYLDGRSEK